MLSENSVLLERYVDSYGTLHKLSDARKQTIRGTIRELDGDIRVPFRAMSERHARDWLVGLSRKGQAATTIRKKVMVVRTFVRWLQDQGAHPGLEWSTVRAPRVKKQKPRPYSPHELKQFWDDLAATWPLEDREWYLGRFRRGQAHYRRVECHTMHLMIRALVRVAIAAGPRRAELLPMRVDDLHWENEYVMIQSVKGGEPRKAPHTHQSREAVRDWLEWRDELFMAPSNLGVDDHGMAWISGSRYANGHCGWLQPIGSQRWEKILHLNGQNWSMHRFRHTCGTLWYRNGMDLGKLQRLMGHANIQQTLAYAELTGEDVVEAAAKLERDGALTF